MLTEAQLQRYSRQIVLPQVSRTGQERLLRSSALIVGAGGLGSPAALYLAAAGVGRLGIVDSDQVELSNLHRQILHTARGIGQSKAEAARAPLEALNPDVQVTAYPVRLTAENVERVLSDYQVVVDGSDNFPTRYLLNDACVLSKKPLVHAGIVRWEGQLFTILPGQGPCYRCLFAEPPPPGVVPGCAEAGVLGAVAGVVGTLQAMEALKLLLGAGQPLVGRLLIYQGLMATFREVPVRRDPACPVCGDHPTIRGFVDYAQFCQVQ